MEKSTQPYTDLISEIKILVSTARRYVAHNANQELLKTYWNVVKLIIERERNDNINEKSSRALLVELSKALTFDIGTGFSRANLFYVRLFFLNLFDLLHCVCQKNCLILLLVKDCSVSQRAQDIQVMEIR